MTWHLAAVVFAAFGIGADYGSTLAALRVPGIREGGLVARHTGPTFATMLTVALVLVLATVPGWPALAALAVIGATRLWVALRNADAVARAVRRI